MKGLGTAVPAVGILVGRTLNWTAPEATLDAADMAYRLRFLLDELLGELAEAGESNLH
jgi:hypothetical protein